MILIGPSCAPGDGYNILRFSAAPPAMSRMFEDFRLAFTQSQSPNVERMNHVAATLSSGRKLARPDQGADLARSVPEHFGCLLGCHWLHLLAQAALGFLYALHDLPPLSARRHLRMLRSFAFVSFRRRWSNAVWGWCSIPQPFSLHSTTYFPRSCGVIPSSSSVYFMRGPSATVGPLKIIRQCPLDPANLEIFLSQFSPSKKQNATAKRVKRL